MGRGRARGRKHIQRSRSCMTVLSYSRDHIYLAPSVAVMLLELLADLVGDLFLILALVDEFLVAQHVADGLLGLADNNVLPGRRRLGRLVIAFAHAVRLTGSRYFSSVAAWSGTDLNRSRGGRS